MDKIKIASHIAVILIALSAAVLAGVWINKQQNRISVLEQNVGAIIQLIQQSRAQ